MWTEILVERIDAILPFLDLFESEGFQGLQQTVDGLCINSEPVRQFNQALYDNKWVVPFDWPSWSEGLQYVEQPELIASADLRTIRKLLTAHARQDHFCDGHLGVMCENGHIAALLRRLREIRAARLLHPQREVGESKLDTNGLSKTTERADPNQMKLFDEEVP